MCDSAAVAPVRSATGTTLFAKNSDRNEDECQPFLQFPAAAHASGAVVRCTHIEIPQVAETLAVMGHSPWWVWGFEHGVNERAVAIGNQTVFSREDVEPEPGLIGMDLVRLGLERASSAREAIEVIAALIERHGQGGPGFGPDGAGYHNSFTLADPDEVWFLETSGRRWAARRSDAGSLSNQLSLAADWDIASRDLADLARSEGWWNGEGRIDVAAAYRNEHVPGRISEGRLARTREWLASRERHDVASLRAMLRDHLEAGLAPDASAGVEDDRYYTLCMHAEPVGTTTASVVAPLPGEAGGGTAVWPVWISFATPCTGAFLPVYLAAPIPHELARGTSEHPEHGPAVRDGSAWWCLRDLQQAASADFAAHAPMLRGRVGRARSARRSGTRRGGGARPRSRTRGRLRCDATRTRRPSCSEAGTRRWHSRATSRSGSLPARPDEGARAKPKARGR